MLKPNGGKCISLELLEFCASVLLKIVFQHQQPCVVCAQQWLLDKEKSITIREALEVKGITGSHLVLQP